MLFSVKRSRGKRGGVISAGDLHSGYLIRRSPPLTCCWRQLPGSIYPPFMLPRARIHHMAYELRLMLPLTQLLRRWRSLKPDKKRKAPCRRGVDVVCATNDLEDNQQSSCDHRRWYFKTHSWPDNQTILSRNGRLIGTQSSRAYASSFCSMHAASEWPFVLNDQVFDCVALCSRRQGGGI